MNRTTLLQPLYRQAAANRRWSECIIEWAVESLTRGVDTPSLRILAGLPSDSYESDVTVYYSSALTELGEIPPSEVERSLGVLRVVARAIVDGDVAPTDGVSRIHTLVVSPLNHPPSLQRWCYLDDGLVSRTRIGPCRVGRRRCSRLGDQGPGIWNFLLQMRRRSCEVSRLKRATVPRNQVLAAAGIDGSALGRHRPHESSPGGSQGHDAAELRTG